MNCPFDGLDFFLKLCIMYECWGAGAPGMLGEIQLSSQRAFEDSVDLRRRYLPSLLPSKAQRRQREAHKSAIDSG